MKITIDLPHSFYSVLKLRANEIREKEGIKDYKTETYISDLLKVHVMNQPEFKKALEITGKALKDKFEV